MPSWCQLILILIFVIALEAWIVFSVGAIVAYTESSNMYVNIRTRITYHIHIASSVATEVDTNIVFQLTHLTYVQVRIIVLLIIGF